MNETAAGKPAASEEAESIEELEGQPSAAEASEASEASGASDVSEADEGAEDNGTSAQEELAEEVSDAPEADDEPLDDLFLSPDEDSEGVIEVEFDAEAPESDAESDVEAAPDDQAAIEVRQEDLTELRDEIDELRERLDEAERESGEHKERWMRAAADLENLRKRTKREKDEFRKFGHDKVALELIPAVDNLERALVHAEKSEDASGVIDGVKMVYRQIVSALQKHGVTSFESKGEKFNPEQHEAIQQVETTEQDTGTIVEEYQKGYFIHDRLLRPALVSVAKRVAGNDNEEHSEASQASDSEASDEEEPDDE